MKKMKGIAYLAFLLNTLLYGSYYSIAKGSLRHIDPIVFTFFVMMTLVPPALCILALSWRNMTRAAIKSGFLLGSCLCLGLVTLSVALKYNSATGTAFFPSLNGFLAALFASLFLRYPITKATWFAGLVSLCGAILLMSNASMGGLRGILIAFIGGLLCTLYIFLADREQKDLTIYWPLLAVELLTMALWANLIALLFGNWQMVHFSFPTDTWAILYIGLGTTFLPILNTVLLQKYVSPVTVSFICVLEPIMGAIVAAVYLHEVLPLDGYLGGGLVVAGTLIHTWSAMERPVRKRNLQRQLAIAGQHLQSMLAGTLFYPVLCCTAGVFLAYKLGGFPPPAWRELYMIAAQMPTLMQQGQAIGVWLLIAQAASWLIAWASLVFMGYLATYRAFRRFFVTAERDPVPLLALPEAVNIDVRALRQMGYTPYAHATSKRKANNALPRRRHLRQRQRPARAIASSLDTMQSCMDIPFTLPVVSDHTEPGVRKGLHTAFRTRLIAFSDDDQITSLASDVFAASPGEGARGELYSDTFGNHWLYCDDLGTMEVRER